MSDTIKNMECPDCKREVKTAFTIAIQIINKKSNLVEVGLVTFGKCEWCFIKGCASSVRKIDEVEIETVRQAARDNLPIMSVMIKDE